jgi:hypothetical protein
MSVSATGPIIKAILNIMELFFFLDRPASSVRDRNHHVLKFREYIPIILKALSFSKKIFLVFTLARSIKKSTKKCVSSVAKAAPETENIGIKIKFKKTFNKQPKMPRISINL